MNERNIEKEVQARVEFKFNELLTGVKNQAKLNWYIAADNMSQKHSHYWEAFEQFEGMLRKEVNMAPPYDSMAEQNFKNARDKAVDELKELLILQGYRGRQPEHYMIKDVVSIVETAMNW